MSTSTNSKSEQIDRPCLGKCCLKSGRKSNWSFKNTAVMVIGFIFFWPVGLFILYWILIGRDVGELPTLIKQQWSKAEGYWKHNEGPNMSEPSDNVVFNEYQQTQVDRIREIKEEIKDRTQRFREYRTDAKRRKDEEEFNKFMADAPEVNNA